MNASEAIANHFNDTVKPCRISGKKPSLQWDGSWCISCVGIKETKEKCKCQMSDGDNATATPILTRWQRERH